MNHIENIIQFRKKTLGLTFLLSAAAIAFAQEKQHITGKIIDGNNNPVPYASVTFENKSAKENKTLYSDAVLTDEKGNYSVNLVPGNYEITIDAIDFKKFTVTKLIEKSTNLSDIKIDAEQDITNSKTKEIQGVTLTASVKPYKVELDKKTYDVNQDIISKGGNLQNVLSNVPSVSVDTDGTVSMRGNTNVRFLINGKPSSLLGIDSNTNALQSIPADQIDRIEVITNPSSKFEASGTAGILNIILKKSKKTGFNGSVTGTLGYLPQTNLNTNLSWKKGNWVWFLNGGGGFNKHKMVRNNFTKSFNASGVADSFQDQKGNTESENNFYNINPGFTVEISDKTSVNVSGMVRYFTNESNGNITYLNYGSNVQNPGESFRTTIGKINNTALQGDIGLDHKFNEEGHNISTSLSFQKNKSTEDTKIKEESKQINDLINQLTNQNTFIGKIDYELPIGENSKLEAGYRIDRNNNNYDNSFFNVLSNSINKDLTSTIQYREIFNAAYVQFKSKIDKFGYQLGLRTENSDIYINSQNLAEESLIKKKNYTGFFPSVFLSYDLGSSDNQLLLNYSRRINRPRSWFLIPFSTFGITDDRNQFFGNEDLNPEYINSFELGYAIQKKKFTINPTLYFRKSQDETQIISVINPKKSTAEKIVTVSKPYNIGSEWQYGLDLNATVDFYPWWKVMGNLDLYGYGSEGEFYDPKQMLQPRSFDGKGFAVSSRLTNTFKVDKTLTVQLQGYFRGAEKTASTNRKSLYSINFGANKTIWKGDGTISFNIQDIFNTRARRSLDFNNSFERDSYMQFQPRQFSISLTYRFKQGEKIEQPKKKRENTNGNPNEEEGPM